MLPRGLALDPFGGERRAGNCRAAAGRLEFRFLDDLRLGIDLHLQLHHVTALGRAEQAGAPIRVILRKAADFARVIAVINAFVRMSHVAFAPVLVLLSRRLPQFSNDSAGPVESGPGLVFKLQRFQPKGAFLDQGDPRFDCVCHQRLRCIFNGAQDRHAHSFTVTRLAGLDLLSAS